ILGELGVGANNRDRVTEVSNRIDLLDEGNRVRLLGERTAGASQQLAFSAVTGEGMDALRAAIEQRVSGELEDFEVRVRSDQLGLTDWLYRNGEVIAREDNEDGSIRLTMRTTQSA